MPICDGTVGNQEGRQGTTATGGETAELRRSRILSPPGDTAQGDQWKTAVNCNNYGSGRALDDENVDNDNNRLGGGGLGLMIVGKDGQAGVATGGDNKENCLCSHLICNDGFGRGAGIRRSIHSECIVTSNIFYFRALQ